MRRGIFQKYSCALSINALSLIDYKEKGGSIRGLELRKNSKIIIGSPGPVEENTLPDDDLDPDN